MNKAFFGSSNVLYVPYLVCVKRMESFFYLFEKKIPPSVYVGFMMSDVGSP